MHLQSLDIRRKLQASKAPVRHPSWVVAIERTTPKMERGPRCRRAGGDSAARKRGLSCYPSDSA
eukprot:15464497-Alexandrium_andersonii.AAC.1